MNMSVCLLLVLGNLHRRGHADAVCRVTVLDTDVHERFCFFDCSLKLPDYQKCD